VTEDDVLEDPGRVSALAVPPNPQFALPPRLALRASDPLRQRQLSRALGPVDEAAAEVLVIDLAAGEALPPHAAAFDGALLILTDDPALAADRTLAGVLPRTAGEGQILAAAAAVAEGLTVRTPAPPERTGFAPTEQPRPLLTPRELEILARVGEGLSNKSIARRLNISAHTVKYHLEAIFAKLGVRSRAEAVTRGLRHGLLVV
jgi:two-component system nitrate/nitrite response regulator NarL